MTSNKHANLSSLIARSGAPMSFDYASPLYVKRRDGKLHEIENGGALVAYDSNSNLVRTWLKPEIRQTVLNPFTSAAEFLFDSIFDTEEFAIKVVEYDDESGEVLILVHLKDVTSKVFGMGEGSKSKRLIKTATFCISAFATKVQFSFQHVFTASAYAAPIFLMLQEQADSTVFGTFKCKAGSKFDFELFKTVANRSSQVVHGLYKHLQSLPYDDLKHGHFVAQACGAPLVSESRLNAYGEQVIPRWMTRSQDVRQQAAGKTLFNVLALLAENAEDDTASRLSVVSTTSLRERFKGKLRAAQDGVLQQVCNMAQLDYRALTV